MDGYSVQEAASVLGVAEGRVWELLARGVLLGTPEGDSMRVFLKAQAGPIASAGTPDEPPRTNGNGGSHGAAGEASAFRELLTEFRNLTERYGQALLALGEARGEVAGLRSRVDQLEARLDLRLPPPVDAAPVAWDSLSVPATTPEKARAMPPSPAPRAPVRRKLKPKARQRKARSPREALAGSPREAVAGFAEALARAQDPNAADLGEARVETEPLSEANIEPASATAVAPDEPMQEAADTPELVAREVGSDEIREDELAAEEAAPAPVATAQPTAELVVEEASPDEPTAQVEAPTYSAVVVEPDWFADGDFAWLDAAEMEGSAEASSATATPDKAEQEPEQAAPEAEAPAAESEPEAQAAEPEPEVQAAEPEPEQQQLQDAQIAPEPPPQPEPEPEPGFGPWQPPEPKPVESQDPEIAAEPDLEREPPSQFEAEAEFESWQPPEPASPEAPAEPEVADAPEPPTASAAVAVEEVEEEVMWLGGESDPSPVIHDEPGPDYRAEAENWPRIDAAPTMEAVRPPLAMTEDELARLALDEGWDDTEVAAIRAMITPPAMSAVDLPGAAELHEAMAALEAVPVQTDPPYDASRQWAKPAPDDEEPARHDDWAFEAEPAPPPPAPTRPPSDVTSALRRALEDPGWLRRRQGPAAEAYRRLRRLFPG
jgi:hypothetical protein